MTQLNYFDALDDLRGITVVHADFVVVTSERCECAAYAALTGLLSRVKSSMTLDVLFVAQALGGEPVPRELAALLLPGECDACEVEYGHTVLETFSGGTVHISSRPRARMSASVVTPDGTSYGTVCCTARGAAASAAESNALQSVANLLAQTLAQTPAPRARALN